MIDGSLRKFNERNNWEIYSSCEFRGGSQQSDSQLSVQLPLWSVHTNKHWKTVTFLDWKYDEESENVLANQIPNSSTKATWHLTIIQQMWGVHRGKSDNRGNMKKTKVRRKCISGVLCAVFRATRQYFDRTRHGRHLSSNAKQNGSIVRLFSKWELAVCWLSRWAQQQYICASSCQLNYQHVSTNTHTPAITKHFIWMWI